MKTNQRTSATRDNDKQLIGFWARSDVKRRFEEHARNLDLSVSQLLRRLVARELDY